jgi:hypothetical protein
MGLKCEELRQKDKPNLIKHLFLGILHPPTGPQMLYMDCIHRAATVELKQATMPAHMVL